MRAHTDLLTLAAAATLTTEQLAHVLNHAYADYIMPIWFTGYQFEQMCDDMDVDLSRSVVAMAEDKPIGIALLSVRGDEGWISGVGVIPAWRRRGVGRAIIRRLQEIARHNGLTRLRLEVLQQNEGGRRLYEETGFAWYRELLVLHMPPLPALPPFQPVRLVQSRPQALLRSFPDFHAVEPSWQRAQPSLRQRSDRLQGYGCWLDRALVGYVLYQAQTDICHVLDLGIDPSLDGSEDLARRILLTLHDMYPDLGGYIVNVPAEDPLLHAFTDTGYTVWHRQDEMVWPVPHHSEPPEA